jgi:hypothetical protein
MRPLIIANFERVEGTQFIAAILHGEDGHLLDAVTLPCESPSAAIDVIRRLASTYRIETVEMWTSDRAIYSESLSNAGVIGTIKHSSDTSFTRRMVEQDAELLREVYGIEPLIPKPGPPKWRAFLISALRRTLTKLEGEFK